MATLLTYIAIAQGRPKRSSLEVLAHVRALADEAGHSVAAVVVDPMADRYVDAISSYGPDTVYLVQSPAFEQHVNERLIAALDRVISVAKPRLVAFASTEAVKDVLGALSVRVGAAAIPDVSSLSFNGDRIETLRPVMASKMLARTSTASALTVVSVRSGSYSATGQPSAPEVISVNSEDAEVALRQTLREVKVTGGGAVDLSEASVVVAAGRGVRDEEGVQLVNELADALGGAVGATRAVVETGLFPATAQIGQTGKVVSPDLYFAVGISGAIQHVAGMVNSRVIVAINRDADAPIFGYSTFGIVGDLYKVLPLLTEQIKAVKQSS